MQKIMLDGSWRMKQAGAENDLPAQVPGSVLADYLRQDLLPDPFYGENEGAGTELFYNDFEYSRSFTISEDFFNQQAIDLVCLGIDTLAEIFINGSSLAQLNNMHRSWRFGIKDLLRVGENQIRIYFSSPNVFIRDAHAAGDITYNSIGNMSGTEYLRKAHCQFGWDWGPKLPDAGIWRSIYLEGYSLARFEDVYITQRHEGDKVGLNIRADILPVDRRSFWAGDYSLTVNIELTDPDGKTVVQSASADIDRNQFSLEVPNPRLWWPNGFGDQPLYTVSLSLLCGDAQLDEYNARIGLRTMTMSTEKDEWGNEFALVVNGVKIFSMGADYIPEDSLFTAVTPERTRRLLTDCAKANFNCIRVWGGGYYPEDFFFDICDELGLVVWQDLMFACNIYVFTDDFAANVEAEARQNIRRIRHHASLGLWCGNNEMEMGWVDWPPVLPHSKALKADYIKLFEVLLPKIAKEEDPETFYWLASPSSTGSFENPNGDDQGDVHYWDVWHGLKPFTAYREHYFRYCSEFGFEALPDIETIQKFAAPEDLNLFSPVMEAHQKCLGGNGKILYYISETYRYPKDFESLVYASQILQMESIQYGVEHWRRYRGRCMGAIYWQLNDCWPVISWSSIDYYGRWKALHYGARRFFAPVMASILNEGNNMRIFTHNESLNAVKGEVKVSLRSKNFALLASDSVEVDIPALSANQVFSRDYSDLVAGAELERSCYLVCELFVDGKLVSRSSALFVAPKAFSFDKPSYTLEVAEQPDAFLLTVGADTYSRFVRVAVPGEATVLSDNYFDIVDGDGVCVSLPKEELNGEYTAESLKKAVTLFSIGDSYARP